MQWRDRYLANGKRSPIRPDSHRPARGPGGKDDSCPGLHLIELILKSAHDVFEVFTGGVEDRLEGAVLRFPTDPDALGGHVDLEGAPFPQALVLTLELKRAKLDLRDRGIALGGQRKDDPARTDDIDPLNRSTALCGRAAFVWMSANGAAKRRARAGRLPSRLRSVRNKGRCSCDRPRSPGRGPSSLRGGAARARGDTN